MTKPETRNLKRVDPSQFDWRRNLHAVWLAEVLAMVGFSSALSFLPYYVQELGITAPGQVELWSGLLTSAQALTMGIMGAVWGSLADRLGRKLMLERAMFGGALLVGAMGFVTNVHQLLMLRILQGAVSGTVAASYTLVAAGTPENRRAFALGTLQVGIYLGASFGPVLGGFVADIWGYRVPFLMTGALLAVGGVLVATTVREVLAGPERKEKGSLVEGLRLVLRSRGVLSVFGVRLLVRSALRTVRPTLPLFVQMLVPVQAKVASLVGLVTGANMAASAVGSVVVSRVGERLGLRKVLMALMGVSMVCYLLQSVVSNVAQLLFLQGLAGLAMGGILISLSAALAQSAPEGRQGAVFGLDTSVISLANAIGPMLGGAMAASWGLRVPFLAASFGFALAVAALIAQGSSQRRVTVGRKPSSDS